MIKSMKTEFEFSAGGIVRKGEKVLLIKAGPLKTDEAYWTFPKGKIEPGETPEIAALREVREEAGLICCIESKAGVSRYIFRRGEAFVIKEVRWFAMGVSGESSASAEYAGKMRWETPEAALNLLKYRADISLLNGYLAKK